MSVIPGVLVDAAYHAVSVLAGLLAALPAGLATAAAIIAFTVAIRLLLLPLSYRATRGMEAQARLAPQVLALRQRHAGQPDRLQRDLAALYRAEGTSMFAGFLPTLAQWPVLGGVYLLFRSPRIAGAPNRLLSHGLFGAPLGSHWLSGAGPLSAQGAVFAGLFLLLAAIAWLSARLARGSGVPAATAPAAPGKTAPGKATPGKAAPGKAAPATGPGGRAAAIKGDAEAGRAAAAPGLLARALPYASVAVAAFVPLAAGLYLVTTTAWTLGERMLARRLRTARAGTGAIDRRGPAG
jgi:YidC/Oxa1 family membrane protein insertase